MFITTPSCWCPISSTLPGILEEPCGVQPPEYRFTQVAFFCQVESSHLIPAVTQGTHLWPQMGP